MINYDEFNSYYQKLKSMGKVFSNTILFPAELKNICEKENSFLFAEEQWLCLYYKEKGIWRLNYYTLCNDSFIGLKNIIEKIQFDSSIICDVVGKHSSILDQINKLGSCGFQQYALYHRWKRKKENYDVRLFSYQQCIAMFENTKVEVATIYDKQIVKAIVAKKFESFISHVPDEEFIEKAISKGEVFKVISHDEIKGIYIVEKLNKNLVHLHILAVHDECDGAAYGVLIFCYVMEHYGKSTEFTAYIDDKNSKSINIVKNYGFEKDLNMENSIMKFKDNSCT